MPAEAVDVGKLRGIVANTAADGRPMRHPDRLPQQTVAMSMNETEIGSVGLRALSLVALNLSALAVGSPIVLTLHLPDVTHPNDLGTGHDDRQPDIALRWVTLLRAEAGRAG